MPHFAAERHKMEFEHIIYEVRDGVAYITLNHPEKRNPLSVDTQLELHHAFDLCDYDETVRAVVLRGAGGVFCGGGDLKVMKRRIDANVRGTREACCAGAETNLRLRHIKKPTIAWVEGAVAGAGIALALACDFQIVAENTKCVFAFVNIGFVPDCGSTYFVTRAIGTTRTTELFMSGRRFSGKEAAEWGLFTEAVPEEKLEARVMEYIEKYKNGPTVSYAGIKEMINRAQFSGYADTILAEVDLQGRCETTQDYRNAVASFLAKEKPHYIGG